MILNTTLRESTDANMVRNHAEAYMDVWKPWRVSTIIVGVKNTSHRNNSDYSIHQHGCGNGGCHIRRAVSQSTHALCM